MSSEEKVTLRTLLGRPTMYIKIGLIGLPNCGKSTLFNVLTNNEDEPDNYPFSTIGYLFIV